MIYPLYQVKQDQIPSAWTAENVARVHAASERIYDRWEALKARVRDWGQK